MDKFIPFLNALSWMVIIIALLVWVVTIRHYLSMPPAWQRLATFKFGALDLLAVIAICWLVTT